MSMPAALKISEYVLDRDQFTLTHANQRRDSSGRKRRIEFPCDVCGTVYVTKLRDEIRKEFPWLCRGCRTKKLWEQSEYRAAIMNGVTDELRQFRRSQRSSLSKQMWNDPDKHAVLSAKLRQRDPSVYSKARRAMRRSVLMRHWKTGEEITCVGSYEAAFVNWCNLNKIDFDWQLPHKMPDGRTYIVDAYIKTGEYAGMWVEVKGYMSSVGREKWEWFHVAHPTTSQLWTQERLKQLEIIT
jgi:hypothetical protein